MCEPVANSMEEARAHLGAALIQSLPDIDDQIIMGHVREAYLLLGGDAANVARWTTHNEPRLEAA